MDFESYFRYFFNLIPFRSRTREIYVFISWRAPKKVTVVDEVSAAWTPTRFKLCAAQGTKVANSLRRKM